MILGNTLEEKKECYEKLMKTANKWSKVLGIIGLVCGSLFGLMIISESFDIGTLFLSLFLAAALSLSLYICGRFYYFGFLTVKGWLTKSNVSVGDVAGAVGLAAIFSGILGGRKAAKTSLIMSAIIILVAIAIGIYVGIYKYFKLKIEAKKLGIA